MKSWTVYFVIAPLVFIVLLVWLFGLGGYDRWRYGPHYIESRTAAWQGVIASELPIGSSNAQIEEWARRHSFVLYQENGKKDFEIVLETIPWHQVVCTEWKIIAEINMNGDWLAGEKVVSMGACL